MNVQISPENQQFLQQQIELGVFASEDQALNAAIDLMKRTSALGGEPSRDSVIGLFADTPELMDQIVEEAYQNRERDPLRLKSE